MCTVGSVEQCIKVHAFDALSGYLASHPILAQVEKFEVLLNEVGQ